MNRFTRFRFRGERVIDAVSGLQVALHQVYDAARYVNYIYEGLPEPQLSADDAYWAQRVLTGGI